MIHIEVPYLLEWIEFHRIQGVNHFVLYTYFGTDLVEYIPRLYESTGLKGLVDVHLARFFAQESQKSKRYG